MAEVVAGARGPVRAPVPGLVALLAAVLAVLLAGCASLPTSGPVRSGSAVGSGQDPAFRVAPAPPAPGASPEEVVRGFLAAGVEVEDEFATARQYLSAQQRGSWRPTTRTVVHPDGEAGLAVRAEPVDPAAQSAEVVVTTAPLGVVDEAGRFDAAPVGAAEAFTLSLVREEGQWRISDVPDLLLVAEPDFLRTFRPRALYFATGPDGPLVPEVRWFADRPASATTLVTELLAGPSPWLAPAVVSGAPVGAGLGRQGSVAITDREARVELPGALVDTAPTELALLQRQLQATLQALPRVDAVRVTVDGGELDGAGGAVAVEPAVDSAPVLVTGESLARLRGGVLEPVEELPPLAGLGISDPGVLGGAYAVLAGGRTQLLLLERDQEEAPEVVLTGTDLTAPSLDRTGWTWSTSAVSPGTVTAVSADGEVAEVAADWLQGRSVHSLRASRDGARVVVASSGPDAEAGGAATARVDIASVRRDPGGAPLELAVEPGQPTPWLSSVTSAVWVDGTTVAVLGVAAPGSARDSGGAPEVFLLTGGWARALGGPEGAVPVELASGSGARTIIVGTADGVLWQRAGSRWVVLPGAAGAGDPAFAG